MHKSSFKLAGGFSSLEKLAAEHKDEIELYVVSARFACLTKDSEKWEKVFNRKKIFKKIYFNCKDEQPHAYKQKMIEKLDLDYFVEDNWDVAYYLHKNQKKAEVWWLSNFLDRTIEYQHKFFSFRQVVEQIKTLLT